MDDAIGYNGRLSCHDFNIFSNWVLTPELSTLSDWLRPLNALLWLVGSWSYLKLECGQTSSLLCHKYTTQTPNRLLGQSDPIMVPAIPCILPQHRVENTEHCSCLSTWVKYILVSKLNLLDNPRDLKLQVGRTAECQTERTEETGAGETSF